MADEKKCDWCGRLFTGDWVIGSSFFFTQGFCSKKCREESEKSQGKQKTGRRKLANIWCKIPNLFEKLGILFRSLAPAKMKQELVDIPDTLKTQIFEFIKHQGLVFSPIDFIVTPDYQYIFLENNCTALPGVMRYISSEQDARTTRVS